MSQESVKPTILSELKELVNSEVSTLNNDKRSVGNRLTITAGKRGLSLDEAARSDPDLSFELGKITAREELVASLQAFVVARATEEDLKSLTEQP